MTSWNIKGTLPKSGRWFSWMESCQSFLREWWASRMILEWYLGPDTPNPDDNLVGKFVELRSGRGGLKLCHIILSSHYWENCHILLTCNRPLWDAYTEQVTTCKSASHAVAYASRMSTQWHVDDQFRKLVRILTCDDQQAFECFRRVAQWSNDEHRMAEKSFQYLFRLVANRAQSLSQHITPPLCYASLLDDRINDDTNRDRVLNLMKFDWLSISVCETSRTVPGSLTTDLGLTMTPPCRLLMILCESHRFCELPSEGKDLLRAMIHIPADSKIIEDVHQCVRLAQKTRASHEKLGVPAVQNLVNNSKVMASRDLNHPAKLDKQSFLSTLRQTGRNFKTRQKGYGRRHKLPKSYGRIMSTKLWPSITPASLGRSAAAWAWVRAFRSQNLRQSGVQLKEWLLTKRLHCCCKRIK